MSYNTCQGDKLFEYITIKAEADWSILDEFGGNMRDKEQAFFLKIVEQWLMSVPGSGLSGGR